MKDGQPTGTGESMAPDQSNDRWNEKYPHLGTDPIPIEPYISREYLALEREWIFRKVWPNVGRIERPPDTRPPPQQPGFPRPLPIGEERKKMNQMILVRIFFEDQNGGFQDQRIDLSPEDLGAIPAVGDVIISPFQPPVDDSYPHHKGF